MLRSVAPADYFLCGGTPEFETVLLAVRVSEDVALRAVRAFDFFVMQEIVRHHRDRDSRLVRQEVFLD
jgi:hypothetical protein